MQDAGACAGHSDALLGSIAELVASHSLALAMLRERSVLSALLERCSALPAAQVQLAARLCWGLAALLWEPCTIGAGSRECSA